MINCVWKTMTCSVRGASHIRNGLPNQDCAYSTTSAGQNHALITVADGHGSARSFRSDIGSKIAVRVANKIFFELRKREFPSFQSIKEWAENELPKEIVRRWQDIVLETFDYSPFNDEELERLRTREGENRLEQVLQNPLLAYGSTLLGAIIAPEYIIYFQLGDGDILTVSENDDICQPIQIDTRLIANETTSLCLPKAWEDVRITFQPLSTTVPKLILITTDGYPNSFVDSASFLKAGSDFLQLIKEEGHDYVEQHLEEWLREASQSGSGDDTSVGIGYMI